jgi:hypothetical protein
MKRKCETSEIGSENTAPSSTTVRRQFVKSFSNTICVQFVRAKSNAVVSLLAAFENYGDKVLLILDLLICSRDR